MPTRGQPSGVALLLSQLGSLSAARLGDRLAVFGLTPAHLGILRVVGQRPGLNQREVAQAVGAAPSRVVGLVDDLEREGLIRRRRSEVDRRSSVLDVPPEAAARLSAVRAAVAAHDDEIVAPLSAQQRAQLLDLLSVLSAGLGQAPHAHPGYQAAREG